MAVMLVASGQGLIAVNNPRIIAEMTGADDSENSWFRKFSIKGANLLFP